MLFSRKFRPQRFDEVEGQELPKMVLRSFVQNPSKSPQVLVLKGDYGTGKTSCARILARALNCLEPGVEPCLTCVNCLKELSRSPFYREYDCSVSGSAEDARQLRETFFLHVPKDLWRVVVFDEAHLFSVQAQAVFLKVLEESLPPRMFVLFCTTDPKDLLAPIINRSVELYFSPVPIDGVLRVIRSVSKKSGIEVSDLEAMNIARASGGHVRAAVLALQTLSGVSDRNAYLEALASPEETSMILFAGLGTCNRKAYRHAVEAAAAMPLETFRKGFYDALHGILQTYIGEEPESPFKDIYGQVAPMFGSRVQSIVTFCLQPWFTNAMQAGSLSQMALWSLWAAFGEVSPQGQNSRLVRGAA